METAKRRPGLGTLVLVGFILGVICGLFFGELAAVLSPIGRAYVRLLQMAIIPYIMVSLIAGLGRLTPQQASRIAIWGGAVLMLILSSGMILMLLIPLAFPNWEAANYFSSSLLSEPQEVDFVSLYISANPFDSLANTVVPAIVLFSLIMGVAVMQSESKKPLLALLTSLDEALMNITRFVVKLAPVGIFAISANAAGTLDITAFDKLQVYVWGYLLLWALLFFALLPGLLIGLTPITYKEIFTAFRIPFITSFVTGSVLVVLPMMIEEIRRILETHDIADDETEATVDVLIPTTFNFPSVAMLLVLSFVLFSGWYSGNPVPLASYPQFAITGLFVAFGGSNIALPFLLDMFRLPADMFQLFLVANVITNLFFMALSAMNLAVITLLAIFFIKRRISPRPKILLTLLGLLFVVAPLMLKGMGSLIENTIAYEYRGYSEFVSRGLTGTRVMVRNNTYQEDLTEVDFTRSRLESIKTSGWLRVGHSSDALPWAFHNKDGEAVGYDIELLHGLASSLEVGLEITKVEQKQVAQALASGQIDIYASGMTIDVGLLGGFDVSKPYAEATLGLLVPDHRRKEFQNLNRSSTLDDYTIAVLGSPLLENALNNLMPGTEVLSIESPREFLRGNQEKIDAIIMSAEAASAWTLIYPQFSVVVLRSGRTSVPIVFALPLQDEKFADYINIWISASSSLGIMDQAYEHWILGRNTDTRQARWSVIRDLLHWVD